MNVTIDIFNNEKIQIPKKSNLLDGLRENDVPILAICGKKGVCGKCRIKVLEGKLKPSKSDKYYFTKEELDEGNRLACTAFPEADLKIKIISQSEDSFSAITYYKDDDVLEKSLDVQKILIEKNSMSISEKIKIKKNSFIYSMDILKKCSDIIDKNIKSVFVYYDEKEVIYVSEKKAELFGIAIDIGTTTITFALINLESGEVIGKLSSINKQRDFGGDVITRIEKSLNGDLEKLNSLIKKQISEGIKNLCKEHSIKHDQLIKIGIAGNTTMLHFLLGLSCKTIGVFPFTPVTLDFLSFRYDDLFKGDFKSSVYILPGLTTYVGADITSGILFTEIYKSKKPEFLLDIGTNGEMALGFDNKIICTSTSAGPAFEGGNILWGTGSISGAISYVDFENGNVQTQTIDNKPPVGICGSGVVDAAYQCFKNNFINKRGKFEKDFINKNASISKKEDVKIIGLTLGKTSNNEEIIFTQKDIREYQLGKSAIRSGIDSLLKYANMEYEDLETLYIAGGFGYKIDIKSAIGTGLIPKELESKVVSVGNSSLGGVIKFLINSNYKSSLEDIIGMTEGFNLSDDMYFNKAFIENINF